MRASWKVLKVAFPLLALLVYFVVRSRFDRFDGLPYRGQTYKLGKSYSSWEGFKSDPSIAPDQLAAAQKAVESSPITPKYMSRWDRISGVTDLRFPGFGSAQFGEHPAPDGSILAGDSFEVPLADKDRIVVYRGQGDTWTLIDDFVWSPGGTIMHVDEVDGKLVYKDLSGKEVVTRDPQSR